MVYERISCTYSNKENLVGRFYSKEEIEHTIGISTCFRMFFGEMEYYLYDEKRC